MMKGYRREKPWLHMLMLLGAILLLGGCSENSSSTEQIYTSTDGTLTFTYPSGWAVRENSGQIFLGTNAQLAEAAANGNIVAEPGQFVASVFLFPALKCRVWTRTLDCTNSSR